MANAWWLDPEIKRADPDLPIYSEETGWARLDPSSEEYEGDSDIVQLTLKPRIKDPIYSERKVRLSLSPAVALDVRDKLDKTGKLRRPSSLPMLRLMLEILQLREPPLIPGPFSHGAKLTRFTSDSVTGQKYATHTREGKYREARWTGDPLEFARALRDLIQRKAAYGERGPGEELVLSRMANEMAFEIGVVLPQARSIRMDNRLEWCRDYLNNLVNLDLFGLGMKR